MGDIPFLSASPQSHALRMEELLGQWTDSNEGKSSAQEDTRHHSSSTFSFLDDTDEDICQQDILERFDMLEHADVSERVTFFQQFRVCPSCECPTGGDADLTNDERSQDQDAPESGGSACGLCDGCHAKSELGLERAFCGGRMKSLERKACLEEQMAKWRSIAADGFMRFCDVCKRTHFIDDSAKSQDDISAELYREWRSMSHECQLAYMQLPRALAEQPVYACRMLELALNCPTDAPQNESGKRRKVRKMSEVSHSSGSDFGDRDENLSMSSPTDIPMGEMDGARVELTSPLRSADIPGAIPFRMDAQPAPEAQAGSKRGASCGKKKSTKKKTRAKRSRFQWVASYLPTIVSEGKMTDDKDGECWSEQQQQQQPTLMPYRVGRHGDLKIHGSHGSSRKKSHPKMRNGVVRLEEDTVKGPPQPKHPVPKFILFSTSIRSDVVASMPDLKPSEVQSKIGELWRERSAEVDMKFSVLAEQDKERYLHEKEEYDRIMKESEKSQC
eukprot:TRINITY_DN57023_c0_g1_i1.p1 TRINITY_DN57023_c0_g1~~TRINITY_DN57023_c0_g1_i1.p1  ORF type:complete len:502 (-),score=124.97 TRINITY_DN57023_c0_g1_i1:48-1553(-)